MAIFSGGGKTSKQQEFYGRRLFASSAESNLDCAGGDRRRHGSTAYRRDFCGVELRVPDTWVVRQRDKDFRRLFGFDAPTAPTDPAQPRKTLVIRGQRCWRREIRN